MPASPIPCAPRSCDIFKVILVGTDGSESADRALSLASDLAREHQSRLLVVHVDEIGGYESKLLTETRREIHDKIRDQVEALKADGLDAHFELRQMTITSPAHALADAAAGVADLIVLGNVGSGPLKGLLLGSVAYRMLHIAPCPVMVVPKPES
jgi:nucleotide-binding universal stress UspA family protein